jgi:hypothetical protein
MKSVEARRKLTYWQRVFVQSKVTELPTTVKHYPDRFGAGRRTRFSSADCSTVKT